MTYSIKFYDRTYVITQDQVDALPILKTMFSDTTSKEFHSSRSPKLFTEVLEYVAGSCPVITPELIDELDYYGINIFDGVSVDIFTRIFSDDVLKFKICRTDNGTIYINTLKGGGYLFSMVEYNSCINGSKFGNGAINIIDIEPMCEFFKSGSLDRRKVEIKNICKRIFFFHYVNDSAKSYDTFCRLFNDFI